MTDRFRPNTFAGWPLHQILWVRAAMTLSLRARGQAYQDIADMTGRHRDQVQDKAYHLAKIDRRRAAETREAA